MTRKKNGLLLAILLLIAIVALPTGTPEDAFTTLPMMQFFGENFKYVLLAGVSALIAYDYIYRKSTR